MSARSGRPLLTIALVGAGVYFILYAVTPGLTRVELEEGWPEETRRRKGYDSEPLSRRSQESELD